MLSLDQLRVLAAIADTGSLAAAARELHLTQPTISHHLAALEANLGGRVVTRGPTGSRLTELGSIVLPQARAVTDQVAMVERDGRAFVEHGIATLDIGCFPTAAATLLPEPLADLRRRGQPFRLSVAEPPEIAAQCVRQAYDVAILASEPWTDAPAPATMSSRIVLDDPLLVVMPPDHPLTERRTLDLVDVLDEPWVITTRDADPEYTLLLRAFAERGRAPHFVARVDDVGVTQALVSAGLGLSLWPRLVTPNVLPTVQVRPISDPRFARRVHVAWRPGGGSILGFIDHIVQTADASASGTSR